jgi:hypothetical protein
MLPEFKSLKESKNVTNLIGLPDSHNRIFIENRYDSERFKNPVATERLL